MFQVALSFVCIAKIDCFFLMSLGSPFHVNVRDRLDANRVNVKMNSNMRANVLQEIIIDGQTAGPGSPTVDITDAHGEFLFFLFFWGGGEGVERRTIIYFV
jgi:hypothetical protein